MYSLSLLFLSVQFKYSVQHCIFIKLGSVHVTCIHSPSHFLLCGYLLRTPDNLNSHKLELFSLSREGLSYLESTVVFFSIVACEFKESYYILNTVNSLCDGHLWDRRQVSVSGRCPFCRELTKRS